MASFDLTTLTTGSPVPPSFDPGRLHVEAVQLPLDVEKLKAGVKIPAFLPFFDAAQNIDETPTMRVAYRRMLSDPTVKGAFLSKVFSVMALNLTVRPPKRLKKDRRSIEIAEFCEWSLKHGMSEGIPGMVWDILSGGLIDGFSICEKVWGKVEPKGRWKGKRRLRAIKAKDVDQDLVIEIDEFKNLDGIRGLRYNGGEVFDPKDFVVYTHLGLFENPTGMSDFRAVYARYWMLDAVWKLRATACDKRAIPLLVGLWKDPAQRGNLELALAAARFQNWISAPADAQITAVNIAGQADNIFAETIKDLREEIIIGIKGSTLTAMTSSDERGDSKIHKDTTDLWGWQLSAAILNLLNSHETGLLRDIVDRNYTGVDEYPLAAFGGIDDKELKETLDIDRVLWDLGWPLDRDEMEEKYGRKWQTDPALAIMKPGGMPLNPGQNQADQGNNGVRQFSEIRTPMKAIAWDGAQAATAPGGAVVNEWRDLAGVRQEWDDLAGAMQELVRQYRPAEKSEEEKFSELFGETGGDKGWWEHLAAKSPGSERAGFESFIEEYHAAFVELQKVKPGEAGFEERAAKMAALHRDHPDWAQTIDDMPVAELMGWEPSTV